MDARSGNTVVLGLGNVLHADDGVGPQAIGRLCADSRVPAGVSLVEGGTLGLELLPYVWDCARLIVIDAIDIGEASGTVVRISGEELNSLPGKSSAHQLGVADLLVALRMLAERRPQVVLLGVQPGSTDWSDELSAPVAAAMDSLVEATIRELQVQAEPDAQGSFNTRQHS
jgi:hydrogenase maturation protease